MTDKNASILIPLLLIFAAGFSQIILAAPEAQMVFGLNNDSAMRLAGIRDLQSGQGWRDMFQYRLGLEGGFEMHWSRIVDAPLLMMLGFLSIFLSQSSAEYWLLILWPLLWFWITAIAFWRLAGNLAGPIAALYASVVGASVLLGHHIFRPGSVDHHNIQIALIILILFCLVQRHRAQVNSGVAGILLAASLGIGVETMPHLVLIAAWVAVVWFFDPIGERIAARNFGVGLLVGLVVCFAGFLPKSAFVGGYCDAMSVDLGLPLGAGALGLVLLTIRASNSGFGIRLIGALLAAAVAAVLAIVFYPSCLTNPLDYLDPYLYDRWINHVSEAQSLIDVIEGRAEPIFLGYFVLGTFAICVCLWLAATRAGQRREWLLFGSTTLIALFFSIYQIRGVVLLASLSVIPVSILAVAFRDQWQRHKRPLFGVLFVLLLAASVPSVWGMAIHGVQRLTQTSEVPAETESTPGAAPHTSCFNQESLAALAALTPGVIASNSNLGALIVLHTQHRVLSAPYHRNQSGMIAALKILTAPNSDEAYELMRDLKVDFFVTCTVDPELGMLNALGYSGFGIEVQRGNVPDFLYPIVLFDDFAIKVYRVQ